MIKFRSMGKIKARGGKAVSSGTLKVFSASGKFVSAVNGTYYAVEAVPDPKAKKLQVVSAYMSKAKKWERASPEHAH